MNETGHLTYLQKLKISAKIMLRINVNINDPSAGLMTMQSDCLVY